VGNIVEKLDKRTKKEKEERRRQQKILFFSLEVKALPFHHP